MVRANKQRVGSFVIRVARVSLGSILLLAILTAHIPASALDNGSLCTLSCCAGKAPHAAGSCMGNSCDAFSMGHAHTASAHTNAGPEKTEELCGLDRLIAKISRLPFTEIDADSTVDANHSRHSDSGRSSGPSLSTPALDKPCQSDCGSYASSVARSKEQRTAALGFADQSRSLSTIRSRGFDYGRTHNLSAMCRRGAPRGPPSFVS